MSWHSLRGHDRIVSQFRRALSRGRLASTFLFVGPPGIGKRTFALKLAQSLLCERSSEEQLNPCEDCPSCRQVAALGHPDVELVRKPADKAFIPVELLIGDAEHRMRAGLCYQISLKPYSGRRKVAIIDDADYLNKEGANCLLKTLEEPPPRSLLILIGASEQRQLPTIRSRCQIVRFRPLPGTDIADLLLEQNLCIDRSAAERAAARANGSLLRAAQWCDPALLEFRRDFLSTLAQSEPQQSAAGKLIGSFVDEAGKESAAKRQRLRLVVSIAEDLYRSALCPQGAGPADAELATSLSAALRWMPVDGPPACLDICHDAYTHIDANVNQATFIEWCLDELAAAARTGRIGV